MIDSPGHAKHHHAYQLGDAAFTGDVTGCIYPISIGRLACAAAGI